MSQCNGGSFVARAFGLRGEARTSIGAGASLGYRPPYIWIPYSPYAYPRGYSAYNRQYERGYGYTFGNDIRRSESGEGEKRWALRARAHRSTSAERARVHELLAAGDADFQAAKFASAAGRYATATRISQESAEAHFRRGFALVANGGYTAAVAAFRRGLALGTNDVDGLFSLEEICGAELLADTNDQLTNALQRAPLDTDLLVCMGLQLLYGQQPRRAKVYLSQAAELGALASEDVERLLPQDPVVPRPAREKLITKVGF